MDKWPSEAEYIRWCQEWLELCLERLMSSGSMYIMCGTQFMAHFDMFLRQRCTVRARIVWYYDSSGVQARSNYGSLWEPILYCKEPKEFVFNAADIQVVARTGAERRLIDYWKAVPRADCRTPS